MACSSCGKKYASRSARPQREASTRAMRRYAAVMRSQKPVVQVQPAAAVVVPRPDCGDKDASTGQLISVIKNGTSDPSTDTSMKEEDYKEA